MSESKLRLKVFLCHSSQDKPVVFELYKRLLAEDWIDPWLDKEKLKLGQDFDSEIEKAIESADAVVAFISKSAVSKTGYIQKELKLIYNTALYKPEGRLFAIPLRLEECNPPYSLKLWHWGDYFGSEKEKTYELLLESLKIIYGQVKADEQEKQRTVEEKAEREVAEKAAKEKAEREAAEKAAKEKVEREAAEKAAKEKAAVTAQDRVLEAAIQKQVTVNKPASLYVWIKQVDSKSIISIVKSDVDENAILDENNVKSKGLEIEFPIENGVVGKANVSLRLVAPEFSPSTQQKEIRVPVDGDSDVCTFIVTPQKTGELLLNIEVLKGEFSVANRSLWTTAIETETKEISPMVLATIPMVVVVHGESHISKSQSNSVAVGSINIGGNVSGNIIIGSNNQVSQVSESNDNEKVYSEKFERERVEKIALEKAEREASEKVAKEKAYREAAEKAAKEKAEREVAKKAAREIVGQLDARKARIEFEDKMMDVKGYKNSRQTRKQPRRKLKAQIVVALIGAVATVIAGVLSSPLLSKLITNNVTPTSMFIVTKTPKSTNTVIPTVTLTKTPPPTRTKVLTPTSTLTPTNVPQSSILYQEDFEDNQISREWSTVWDIKADESGNHFWVATGTYHAYPNAWFYNLSEDWKNYALETRVKIMNGGVFLNVRNGGVGSLGRYTAWISENDDWVSMAQYTYSPSSFDEIPGAGKNYKFERNTWYLLRVEITDTNLSFFVDNKLVSEVSLPKPIVSTYGSIGFYVTKGDNVYLDNIRVWKLP